MANTAIPSLLAAVLVLAGAPSAWARAQNPPAGEGAALVSLDRLRFEYKCHFTIPEWRGKGEEAFIGKLVAQKEAYKAKQAGEVPAVELLLARAYWEQKTASEARGDADGADASAGLILLLESKDDKDVRKYRDMASAFVVQRNYDRATTALADGNLDEARAKFATVVGGNNPTLGQKAVTAIVGIAKTVHNYQKTIDTNDLSDIGTMLNEVLADLQKDLGASYEAYLKGAGDIQANTALKDLVGEKTRNAGDTQSIQVIPRDVTKDLAGVKVTIVDTKDAVFLLVPEGPEGEPFPTDGKPAIFRKNPFLWHRGVYTVKVFAPGAKLPFAVLHGIAMKDAAATIEFPTSVPEGMVWQPEVKTGGALFVDRFEVTVAQVEKWAGGDEKLTAVVSDSRTEKAADDCPAWFAEEAAAQAYAKAVGKSIPTVDQWLQAASGGRSAAEFPYPWGKEPPDSTRAYASPNASRPEPVGGRPAGASPCGAEDMAGNLAEWVVKDGQMWFLGGYYAMGPEGLRHFEGKSPLLDPMPGPLVYDSWAGTDRQNQFLKYRYKADNSYLAGLRTVVPVLPAK